MKGDPFFPDTLYVYNWALTDFSTYIIFTYLVLPSVIFCALNLFKFRFKISSFVNVLKLAVHEKKFE